MADRKGPSLAQRWASDTADGFTVEDDPGAVPDGPVTAAPLRDGGKVLGFVWAAGRRGGYTAKPVGSAAFADAVRYAGMVIDRLGPDAVTAVDRFGPMYALGEARGYASHDAAYDALLA